MVKKKIEPLHTKVGWQYAKVNRIINDIHAILLNERVSFVEQLVITNWFNAELIYNMGKHGARDFIDETFPKPPQSKPSNSGIA